MQNKKAPWPLRDNDWMFERASHGSRHCAGSADTGLHSEIDPTFMLSDEL